MTYCERLGHRVPSCLDSPSQVIAENGLILRVLVGSGVHGTAISGQDDRDEMGICLEPPDSVIGLSKFAHYSYRTQPEGVCSGPGDLDLIVYSARKFARLASQGNPTVLLPLFVPESAVCYINDFGRELRSHRSMFLSRQVGARFKGYLHSQRLGLIGLRSGGTNNQGRFDIREKYGFDTKFAMHMVRLGLQGVELLETGDITLPIPEPDLTWLRELRIGLHSKKEALDRAEELESRLEELSASSCLPAKPAVGVVNSWLIYAHMKFWENCYGKM